MDGRLAELVLLQMQPNMAPVTQTGQTLLLTWHNFDLGLLGERGNEADFAAHVTSRSDRRPTQAGMGTVMLGILGAGNAVRGEG